MPKSKLRYSSRKLHKSQRGGDNSVEQYDMDIVTEEDVHKFTALMDKMMVALISFQADWCGHCKNYKPKWDKLKNTPGRKVPMITVSDKAKEIEPFASANIKGFPTNVVFSGKDKSFATFKDEDGSETNAMPNMHDDVAMTTLLTTDPSKLKLASGDNTVTDDSTESVVFTPTAKDKMSKSAKQALANKNTPVSEMESAVPPNTKNDMIASVNTKMTKPIVKTTTTGGALFQSMLRAIKGLGPTTRRKSRGKRARTAKRV